MQNKIEFWVSNISSMNVSLTDLALTIKAYDSVNLLSKHYYFTKEQLDKSVSSGSIFKKRNKIVVRINAPQIFKIDAPFTYETYIPSRARSNIQIKEEYYEELQVSDEEYALQNLDITDDIKLKKV